MEEAIHSWRNGEQTEQETLDIIHETTNEFREWEDQEHVRLRDERAKANTTTIKLPLRSVREAEHYPLTSIDWEE